MATQIAQPTFRTRAQSVGGNNFNGAVYGDYGIGKTYFSGTVDRVVQQMDKTQLNEIQALLPEGIKASYRTLFINAEQGEEGLPMDCEGIIIKDIYIYKEFSAVYDFLKLHTRLLAAKDVNGLRQLQAKYFQTPPDYPELFIFKACIMDSLTEIQKFCLYQLIGLSPDTQLDTIPDYMQMRQWGEALEMILLMVRSFRGLPIMKIFIIQQTEDTDERKKLFYRPALQGQARSSILGFFDFVGYYAMNVDATTGNVLRRLYLLPAGAFKAKHRFENFKGVYIDNPTMSDIAQYRVAKEPVGAAPSNPQPGRPAARPRAGGITGR